MSERNTAREQQILKLITERNKLVQDAYWWLPWNIIALKMMDKKIDQLVLQHERERRGMLAEPEQDMVKILSIAPSEKADGSFDIILQKQADGKVYAIRGAYPNKVNKFGADIADFFDSSGRLSLGDGKPLI